MKHKTWEAFMKNWTFISLKCLYKKNTHLKFKAYIAQTIGEVFNIKRGYSLSRGFKAQQPGSLPTVGHDSRTWAGKNLKAFWLEEKKKTTVLR